MVEDNLAEVTAEMQIVRKRYPVLVHRLYLCSMAEDLVISTGNKARQYESLIPQIKALLEGEPDLVANLANIAAALKEQFGWFWVGFYLVKTVVSEKDGEEKELVLGPFQGPVACTRIKKGRGVCGSSWAAVRTLIVPDVEKFPGHIACSSLSKSEIVVPVIRNGEVVAVLDADSDAYDQFDATDQRYLEEIVSLIQF
jgi:GAF domain-containing protein